MSDPKDSDSSEAVGSDRRAAKREQAFVGVEVRVPSGEQKLGVVQDASATGLQILTHTRLEVGDRVGLSILVEEDQRLELEGVVMRRDDHVGEGPWRFRVGIQIDAPSDDLVRHAAAIHAQQSWLRREQ